MLHSYSCKEKRIERRKERKKEEKEGNIKKVLHIISCKNGHYRVLRKHYYFNAQCAIVPVPFKKTIMAKSNDSMTTEIQIRSCFSPESVVKMIKSVFRNLFGLFNMADKERVKFICLQHGG